MSQKKAKSKSTTTKKSSKTTKKNTKTAKASKSSKKDDSGREAQRVPIQLLVDYKADGNYLFDFCKDLGSGGVFIQTKKPLPTGSNIDLTFTIPDSKETLSTTGTVIWVQGDVTNRKDLTPGMGVQFSGFSGVQREKLEDFLHRYHGSKLPHEKNVAS